MGIEQAFDRAAEDPSVAEQVRYALRLDGFGQGRVCAGFSHGLLRKVRSRDGKTMAV